MFTNIINPIVCLLVAKEQCIRYVHLFLFGYLNREARIYNDIQHLKSMQAKKGVVMNANNSEIIYFFNYIGQYHILSV